MKLPWNCVNYGHVVYCPYPWATKVGMNSSHGTKEHLNLPALVLKARHLHVHVHVCGSGIYTCIIIGCWLGTGMDPLHRVIWEDELSCTHVHTILTASTCIYMYITIQWCGLHLTGSTVGEHLSWSVSVWTSVSSSWSCQRALSHSPWHTNLRGWSSEVLCVSVYKCM